jgi:hypothetical protein
VLGQRLEDLGAKGIGGGCLSFMGISCKYRKLLSRRADKDDVKFIFSNKETSWTLSCCMPYLERRS